MITRILIVLLVFVSNEIWCQAKPILVFDLINGTQDTIPAVDFDPSITSAATEHSFGLYNSNVEELEQTPPTSNVYPETNYTLKRQASLDYDLTRYPLRTSIKISYIENDTLKDCCSGSLISRRHVLTAAHCVSGINTNTLMRDSLLAFPVFDNGVPNADFSLGNVSKVYFFEDWAAFGEDFAVLELIEPIGEETGWLSIGFEENASILVDGIFYKFSYPYQGFLPNDLGAYNGDTLNYNYGEIDIVEDNYLGISGTYGILGESGSSLIKVANGEEYISYGVLSYSGNQNHSRINNWKFWSIIKIIHHDIVLSTPEASIESLLIYPNPVSNSLYIKNKTGSQITEILIFDNLGRMVMNNGYSQGSIDVSSLTSGIYIMKLKTDAGVFSQKIVKE